MARKSNRAVKKSKVEKVSDSEIFNVEKIILKKVDSKGKVFYLIKWEGYPSSQNTWESEENIYSESLIKEFEESQVNKLTPVEDEFTPMKSPKKNHISPRLSPLRNQPPTVFSVKTVTRDFDTGVISVHFIMSDNSIKIVPATEANVEHPDVVIKFYESRIKFKDSPKHH